MSVTWQDRARALGRTQAVHALVGIGLALTVGVLIHELGHAVMAWALGAGHIRLDLWCWPPRTLYSLSFTAAGWAWIDVAGGLSTFLVGLTLALAVRRWAAPGSWVREVGVSAGGAMAIIDNAQWVVLPIRYALSSHYAADMWWEAYRPRALVPDAVKFLMNSHMTPWTLAVVSSGLMFVYVASVTLVE